MKLRALPLLLLAGCAGCAGRAPQPATLGSLEVKPPETRSTQISASREQAIRGYETFLASARDPLLRAEAIRRLADLRLEDAEARSASGEPDAEANRAVAALYEQRLREHPNGANNDVVLYQLARAQDAAGERAAALASLDRLVSAHPDSELLAEAQFRRGEMLFVDRDYRGAEAAYSGTLARGEDSGFHAEALYKRGWARFKQSQFAEAVDDFMALFDLRAGGGELDLDKLSPAEREQAEDSLRAVSLAFSYLDGPPSIAEYYRERGHRRHEDLAHAGLAELYLSKERYSDAAAALEAFVAARPTHERAPLFQLRAVQVYQDAGFAAQVLEAKQRFVDLYRLDGPFWAGRSPDDHPEVVGPLETTLKDLARHYHALAQTSKAEADYRRAFDGYRAYLASFPRHAGAQEMHFLYAELLFEHRDYADAAGQYEHAAYDFGSDDKAAEAGYAALVAYEQHGKRLQGEEQRNWESLGLTSAQRFAERFPAHPKAAPVLTHAVERLFARGETEIAAQAAERLLAPELNATEPQRLTAWTVIGHSAFDQHDYLKAEHAYQQALASAALKPEQRPALVERLAASIYQQGEAQRRDGQLAAAVEHFLRVAQAAPNSPIRATAEYDAAALLIELKEWPRAIAVLEAFRKDHPTHELQPEVTQKLAVAYMESGDAPAAAREFARIAEQTSDPAIRSEAWLKSADLHEGAGEPAQAAAMLERYVAQFPKPAGTAVESYQRLHKLYATMNDPARARDALVRLIKADREAGAERSDRTKLLAARASLSLAEEQGAAYRQIRLVEPIAKTLPLKKQTLQQSLAAYDAAANYELAEVTTAATFRIAELYGDFAKALLESERPKGLDDEALEQYELMLEEQAYPFEEKAIEVHEANTRRAAKGVYDDWVKQSYAELARLLPARYGKSERLGGPADALR